MPTRRAFLSASASSLALQPIVARSQQFRRDLNALPKDLPTAEDYSLHPELAYLNHGSMGTIPKVVQRSHRDYLDLAETNPSLHFWGEPWQEPRENVRAAVARELGVTVQEIALTHNTTEGFNVLAHGLPLGKGDEVMFTSLNHPGASIPWELQAPRRGFTVRKVALPVDEVPSWSAEDFVAAHVNAVRENTKVVVLAHIDNVIGYRAPLSLLTRALRQKGVRWIAADGAQAAGMVPVNLKVTGVDFYASSPHKWWQAPKEIGVFYVSRRNHEELAPMWTTWGQARWGDTARAFEDYGTRDLTKVLALGDAVAFHSRSSWPERTARLSELRRHAQKRAGAAGLGWLSPADDALGGSLYAIRITSPAHRQRAQGMLESGQFSFRIFSRENDALVRLSPNVANTTAELDRLFDRLDV